MLLRSNVFTVLSHFADMILHSDCTYTCSCAHSFVVANRAEENIWEMTMVAFLLKFLGMESGCHLL